MFMRLRAYSRLYRAGAVRGWRVYVPNADFSHNAQFFGTYLWTSCTRLKTNDIEISKNN